jgi:hypothetical protein
MGSPLTFSADDKVVRDLNARPPNILSLKQTNTAAKAIIEAFTAG